MAPTATPANVAHLLRRAAFGGTPDEIQHGVDIGIDALVDELYDRSNAPVLGGPKTVPGTYNYGSGVLAHWFVRSCVASPTPAIERVMWFWSGHFATSLVKVDTPDLLHHQFLTLRHLGLGRFDDILKAITRDPAMNVWLDLWLSAVGNPNENFARELLELFSMGEGNGYTQADVVAAARAFTGYGIEDLEGTSSRPVGVTLERARHDYGEKTFLGNTGSFDGDDIIDLIVKRRECHEFIAGRFWQRFAGTTPRPEVLAELADVFGSNLRIDELLRAMLIHDAFYEDDVKEGLISQPVELVIRTVRGFDLELFDEAAFTMEEASDRHDADVEAGNRTFLFPWAVSSWTQAMSQEIGYPPNVAGWPHNESWLDSNRAAGRLLASIEIGWGLIDDEHPVAARLFDLSDNPGALTAELMSRFGVVEWSKQTEAAIAAAYQRDDPYQTLISSFAVAFTSPEVTLA